jgi:putative solute:sodium symporter small subunit
MAAQCDDPPMPEPTTTDSHEPRALVLKAVLLSVMLAASFGVCFFARSLSFPVFGWPLHFWMAAQGGVLVFIVIVVVYAAVMSRLEAQAERAAQATQQGTGADV